MEGEHRDDHNSHGKTICALLPRRKATIVHSFPNAQPQRSNEKQILLKYAETYRGELLQMHLPSAVQHSSATDGFNYKLAFFLYISTWKFSYLWSVFCSLQWFFQGNVLTRAYWCKSWLASVIIFGIQDSTPCLNQWSIMSISQQFTSPLSKSQRNFNPQVQLYLAGMFISNFFLKWHYSHYLVQILYCFLKLLSNTSGQQVTSNAFLSHERSFAQFLLQCQASDS